MRYALALCVSLLAVPAWADEGAERPWTLYVAVGIPGMNSFGLSRAAGPVEILAEVGTLGGMPAFVTGAVHVQTVVRLGPRLSLFAGMVGAGLYFWIPDYIDEQPGWGVGPKAGLRYQRGHWRVELEGGALFGEWDCVEDGYRVIPEAALRGGWTF